MHRGFFFCNLSGVSFCGPPTRRKWPFLPFWGFLPPSPPNYPPRSGGYPPMSMDRHLHFRKLGNPQNRVQWMHSCLFHIIDYMSLRSSLVVFDFCPPSAIFIPPIFLKWPGFHKPPQILAITPPGGVKPPKMAILANRASLIAF